jgi:hypothetical protein
MIFSLSQKTATVGVRLPRRSVTVAQIRGLNNKASSQARDSQLGRFPAPAAANGPQVMPEIRCDSKNYPS